MKKLISILIIILISFQAFSQLNVDELKTEAENYVLADNKNLAANTYYKIANQYWLNDDFENSKIYFEEALTLYSEIKNTNATKIINSNLGQIYTDLEQYDLALNYFQTALQIAESENETEDIASQLLNIATIQSYQKNYAESNTNLLKALNLSQQQNNTKLISSCYGTLADNYEKLGETQKSQEYYNFFLTFEKILQKQEVAEIQEKSKTEIEKAISERRAKELELQLNEFKLSAANDSLKSSEIERQLSELEIQKLEQEKLEQDFLIKEQKNQQQKEKTIRHAIITIFAVVLIFLIIMFFQIKQKNKANNLLKLKNDEIKKQALKLAKQNQELEKLSIVASKTENAVVIIGNSGELEWANDAFFNIWGYSLEEYKSNYGNNIFEHNAKSEIYLAFKKCLENKQSVDYVTKLINKFKGLVWTNTTLTPIIENGEVIKVVAIDSNISEIKKAEEKLKDSILYAGRIQLAVLPQSKLIFEFFAESFILFLPRDIVSGDFYWISETEDFIAIAAADCTGHGVPVALMSIMGMSFLSDIIKNNEVKTPAEALENLRKKIKNTLKQDSGNEQRREGMDMALCFVNKKLKKLDFAGAYNPLYILRNKEIEVVKADKMPIGNYLKENNFTNNSIDILPEDVFYIFTDGYSDQFGGEKSEKYKTFRFKKLITDLIDTPLSEQRQIFINALDDWKGISPQMDDILIIGFKVS